MSAPTPISLEHLSDGITSPFWEWFKGLAEREWGAAGERYQQAVQNAAQMKDDNAVHTLRMVIFARQEIERLFRAPAEELNKQRQAKKAELLQFPPSRRGPGL